MTPPPSAPPQNKQRKYFHKSKLDGAYGRFLNFGLILRNSNLWKSPRTCAIKLKLEKNGIAIVKKCMRHQYDKDEVKRIPLLYAETVYKDIHIHVLIRNS